MALKNYRDVSTGGGDANAGFQFEFYCSNCSRKWKSAFTPYRIGQITGFLSRFAYLLSNGEQASRIAGGAADFGSNKAKSKAFAEALPQAERTYSNCQRCENGFCEECLDASHTCAGCLTNADRDQAVDGGSNVTAPAQAGGYACPNCSAPGSGGRFCAECGFDMASTHKSCPGCGVIANRSARFCGDCGHDF